MTQEQIEQAAENYVWTVKYNSLSEDDKIYAAFINGANSRQPEIDRLIESSMWNVFQILI